ncbi:MAG: hypothetical protein P8164_15485 [Gammaproteobacteria bacterium]|jgi:hypothetical protein
MANQQFTSISPETVHDAFDNVGRVALAIQEMVKEALQAGDKTEYYLDAIEALAAKIGIVAGQYDGRIPDYTEAVRWVLGFRPEAVKEAV